MNVTSFEDSYPLSPGQQGMLFHSRYAPRSGVYIQQLICAHHEALDVSAFKQAWQRVVERHSVLRTTFRWEGLDEPRQEVHGFIEIPWEEQDWRSFMVSEQEDRLAAYLETDRQKDFQFPEQPLMRFALVRLGKAEYRFIWTSHHALLDGRSRLILAKEVFAFYDSLCRNENLLLTQPRPYRDYIDWLNQQDFSEHEMFWRPQLRGFKASTPFGIDRPSYTASAEDEKFATQKVELDHSVTEALKRCAQKYDLTLNTLLQGAWALLLSRYSGQDDVIFGATRAARHTALAGTQDMVGLFINTLPIRVRVHWHMSLESLLRELRTQWIKLRDYEHTPLVSIHGWSDVPSGQPLFESLVVFENYQLNSTLRGQGGNWQNREFELLGTTNYPIVLRGEIGEDLLLEISYNCVRFEEGSISRMLGYLQNLLEGMAADPERKLSDLPFLTNAERHQLLVEWNDTKREFPKNKCIHELFEEQVERTPDAVAVIFEDKRITYRELNSKANQLAHYLRKLGVKPEMLVGICLERSLDMLVGVLGILKAGGAYVPLDSAYPNERLAFMLEDTQAAVLLTQQWLVEKLTDREKSKVIQNKAEEAVDGDFRSAILDPRIRVVCLDGDWEEIARQSDARPESEVTQDNLAYVLYTSGSTGNPKGALITHSNLVNAYFAWEAAYQLQSTAPVFLQMANIAFDVFSADWVRALCSGGKLVICPAEFLLDAPQLYALMRREKIDCADFVPLVMRNLINYLDDSGQTLDFMRLVVVGSEVWYVEEYEKIQRLCGSNTRVMNSYGLTEATIDSCFFHGDVSTLSANRAVPIGRPYTNTQLYIVDRYLQLVPVGVPGELCISGAGLARAYLNRAELTAEKFIANPFTGVPEARLYKTGDRARWLPNGDIEFLGRFDHQIKIRGYRVELGEIEVTLATHPAVRQAVVLVQRQVDTAKRVSEVLEEKPNNTTSKLQNSESQERIVAYIVPKPAQVVTTGELRGFLNAKLPEYMLPSAYIFLETIPLMPNGKVDRQALPALDQMTPELNENFVAPRTPDEQKLTGIWSDVLKIARISIYDNFFDLGGHSLLATQVVSRIHKIFGVELALRDFFEAPTIAGTAAAVLQKQFNWGDRQDLDDLLADLEALPIEEARRLVTKQ